MSPDPPAAFRAFVRAQRAYVRYYQAVTFFLSPFFQSDWELLAIGRDMVLPWLPRLPVSIGLLLAGVAYAAGCLCLTRWRMIRRGATYGPARRSPMSEEVSNRRFLGAIIAGAYVLLVAICFAYFYPTYVGQLLTYAEWSARMWLGSRWI